MVAPFPVRFHAVAFLSIRVHFSHRLVSPTIDGFVESLRGVFLARVVRPILGSRTVVFVSRVGCIWRCPVMTYLSAPPCLRFFDNRHLAWLSRVYCLYRSIFWLLLTCDSDSQQCHTDEKGLHKDSAPRQICVPPYQNWEGMLYMGNLESRWA